MLYVTNLLLCGSPDQAQLIESASIADLTKSIRKLNARFSSDEAARYRKAIDEESATDLLAVLSEVKEGFGGMTLWEEYQELVKHAAEELATVEESGEHLVFAEEEQQRAEDAKREKKRLKKQKKKAKRKETTEAGGEGGEQVAGEGIAEVPERDVEEGVGEEEGGEVEGLEREGEGLARARGTEEEGGEGIVKEGEEHVVRGGKGWDLGHVMKALSRIEARTQQTDARTKETDARTKTMAASLERLHEAVNYDLEKLAAIGATNILRKEGIKIVHSVRPYGRVLQYGGLPSETCVAHNNAVKSLLPSKTKDSTQQQQRQTLAKLFQLERQAIILNHYYNRTDAVVAAGLLSPSFEALEDVGQLLDSLFGDAQIRTALSALYDLYKRKRFYLAGT
ncbi:hypothetical protein HDV00_007537 [Rhizophlyctis rosea]|nr:hypothetical protein HDV00_007537 [Rhizophlyctis rosea]